MYMIFEMANNHMGDMAHGRRIIREFAGLAKEFDIKAAIKFQFRQLPTFIHRDYLESDLKYVVRFRETRLTQEQYRELADYAVECGLSTIATPFDNESIAWLEELDISAVKIASCSIDDWPLLREISTIQKKIIISTAGASISTLHKVYEIMKGAGRDFAFMHCVGEYPTPQSHAHLNRINTLRNEFPDIEIGFSTHEPPEEKSLAPIAMAMGCTIIEKHVGVATEQYQLNAYSLSPEQMRGVLEELKWTQAAMTGHSEDEVAALHALKRGIYLNRDLKEGEAVSSEALYFAMPLQEGQLDASRIDDVVGAVARGAMEAHAPVRAEDIQQTKDARIMREIIANSRAMLEEAGVRLAQGDKLEISCHYGLSNFLTTGVVIIEKVNREYCKKLLVVLPNQKHPTHRHIIKEESFELLSGDCKLTLDNEEIQLKKGEPVLIERGVNHSFRSRNGAVVEEISTRHHKGDSIYDDPEINKLELRERKIEIAL